MENFKVVVTGSRYWPENMSEDVESALVYVTEDSRRKGRGITLYHGGCPYGVATDSPYKGADGHADAFGRRLGWDVRPVLAKSLDGRSRPSARDFAVRNRKLIDTEPDIVVAFFLNGYENRGTSMTVAMAEKNNIMVLKINRDER